MKQVEMTIKQLKIELGKLGVAFKAKATQAELQTAYDEAQDRKGLGIHPKNTPVCDSFESPSAKNEVCMTCAADAAARFDACNALANEAKAKTSKKVTPENRETVKGKYADVKELKEQINKASDKRLTMFVDKLLVKGSLTMPEILASVEERKKTTKSSSTDFKNVSIIKKHLKYRATKGWVFEILKNGKVKVVDYNAAGGAIREPAPEVETKKAA